MTGNIRRLAHAILLGFILIAVGLLYWQVARASGLLVREDNPRLIQAELRVRRGRLLDRRGALLAYSDLLSGTRAGGIVQRHYPQPLAAHVVGYYSLRYGTAGAEAAFDAILRGRLTALDQWLHRPQIGDDVTLSLDLAAQGAADRSLGERRGAVVVLDVTTGQVLALVSHPAYDPNTLDEDWEALTANPQAPLLNRATQGVYALGDLARLVGLTGLLSAGITTPPDPHTAPLDEMLSPLSQSGYLATAHQLGFDSAPTFDLLTGPGRLPDFQGQGTPRDLAATPLHMARFVAALAGDGRMPAPVLTRPGGNAPFSASERAFAPGVAAALRAATARHDGLAGWAGVATPRETGDQPLSWFAGYAPVEDPRHAVVVLVEADGDGLPVTLPIAQHTLSAIQD